MEISMLITVTITVIHYYTIIFPLKQNTYSATISSHIPYITYNPTMRIITVACQSEGLVDIYNKIHDGTTLSKQSAVGGRIWLLNARLLVAKGHYLAY